MESKLKMHYIVTETEIQTKFNNGNEHLTHELKLNWRNVGLKREQEMKFDWDTRNWNRHRN